MDERCQTIATQRPVYVPGSLFITALPPSPSPRASPHALGCLHNPLLSAT